MNIVYFLEGTFNSGGIERIVTEKANWLASKGHSVTLVTTDQNGRPDFFPLKGVRRIDFDLMYRCHSKNFISDYFRRRALIKKEKELIEDLVKELKPDYMISTFRYENDILPGLKDKSKKIAEIHFSRYYRLQRRRKGIYGFIDRILTRQDIQQAKKFDKFICLTEEDKKDWRGLKNIEVIHNFIDKKTEEPARLDNKELIAVGRLTYQKGFDRLIKAWEIVNQNFPDWKLNIYGEGNLKRDLSELISSLGLEGKVTIHPPIKEIHQKYLNSSGLVMSSRYEGLPMVMLEAMEAGLPVITYDYKCGPKDIIKDGVNGFIVEEGNIKALANAICKVISSPDLRKEMGGNAFEMAKKYFKETIVTQWEELFSDKDNDKED